MTVLARIKENKEVERFFKFGVVGGFGALVDFFIFNLLGIGLGLSAAFAGGLSFVVAVTSNFILNRYWTFPDSRSRSIWISAGQYLMVNLVGLGIREVILHFATDPVISYFEELALPVSAEVAGENVLLAATIGIVLFWNFFANRIWTYNDVD